MHQNKNIKSHVENWIIFLSLNFILIVDHFNIKNNRDFSKS